MIYKLMIVFLTSMLEMTLAIPLGVGIGLTFIENVIASVSGTLVASFLVLFAGERLRTFLIRKFKIEKSTVDQDKREKWIVRAWRLYGAFGLGIISPLLVGAQVGVAIGIAFGANIRKLMFWTIVGVFFWGIIFSVAIDQGWRFFE